jgi:hypothetical protein
MLPQVSLPCPVVERVRAELLRRAERGFATYGVTMLRDDLSLQDWLQQAKEEALDLAVYLERILMKLESDGQAHQAPRQTPS